MNGQGENNMNIQEQQALAQELSSKLWKMANELRGTMEAYEFKSYILGLIFYKFLSDKTEKFMENLLRNDNTTYEEAWEDEEFRQDLIDESIQRLGYVLEPKYLFRNVVKMIERNEFSIDYLEEIINAITESTQGQASESDFDGLFEDMDLKASKLGKAVSERTKSIAKIITTIDTIEVDIDATDVDVLGTAYVQLIGDFASTAGKKGGEFYTPTNMSKLVARLATVGLTDVLSVFDPTCGSGSLLLQVGKYANVRKYYGQELTSSTYNLARMNMMLHGIDFKNFEIINCNTITDDIALGDKKHMVQVANPPYSVKWTPDPKLIEDERFAPYGKLAPKSYEDLMFVEHMIYHMEDGDSRIACLLPHGVLFRGGAEETIRKFMVKEQNVLDAVIGLPEKCFHGTGIAVACLVFKKQRNGNSDNVCFIDASKYFSSNGPMNYITDEDIDRIVNAYVERKDIDKFCHVASMQEIEENDYNLNIARYVDTFEEEDPVDIQAEREKLADIVAKKQASIDKVNAMMKLLGL